MFERFTDRAKKVMALANQEAQRFNHEYIGTEHILLGLVKEGSGVGASALKSLGVDLLKVRLEVEKLVKSGPEICTTTGKLPQTPRSKRVIEEAIEEARNLNHNYVGTEHLLLGLLREQEGTAAQVLTGLGLKLETVRAEVLLHLGVEEKTAAETDKPAPANEDGNYAYHVEGVGNHPPFCNVVLATNHGDKIMLILSPDRHAALLEQMRLALANNQPVTLNFIF